MIDSKKIEEAAKEFSFFEAENSRELFNLEKTFIEGINWFKENLWHDANEKPKEEACIIVQSKLGGEYCTSVYSNGEFECDSFHLLHKEIIRWLYIEDLMKGGK